MRGIPHEYVAYNVSPDDSYPRMREKLEAASVLEPVEGDNGKVAFYRFHDAATP